MRRMGVLFTVLLSGCSFVLVSGPPANHRELPAFDCTTSRLGPGLGTGWTIPQVPHLATAVPSENGETAVR